MTTLPKITKRQGRIVEFLYLFRFVTSNQIQALLKHKDKRRTNRWLSDLMDKRYLASLYLRTVGDINKPAIYCTSLGAIRYLKTLPDVQETVIARLYRDKTRSIVFRDQCLLIADIAIQLLQSTDKKTQYEPVTASERADPATFPQFLSRTAVEPDLVVTKIGYHFTTYHLIQLLSPTLRPYKTRSIIRGYINLYQSELWENKTDTNFPQVIFVCGTLFQLVHAKRYAHSLIGRYDSIQLDFIFQEDIKTQNIAGRLRTE